MLDDEDVLCTITLNNNGEIVSIKGGDGTVFKDEATLSEDKFKVLKQLDPVIIFEALPDAAEAADPNHVRGHCVRIGGVLKCG